MSEHFTEHVADWRNAVIVERASRTIRNVALAGAESKNGYRYSAAALKGAAALYENVPVFLDHPASPQRPRARSARDLAGSVANARFEEGRLRGDLRTLDTEAGRTLLALAEAGGPGVGMSHVVLAERSRDGATIERIVEVVSVDAVAFPATTSTFRESIGTDGPEGEVTREEGRGAAATTTSAPSMIDPRPVSGTARSRRVRERMQRISRQQVGAPAPTVQRDRARPSGSASTIANSARASRLLEAGSLERLLMAVDAELPGHLRRLAAATPTLGPGRGRRAGVFPGFIVLEWRSTGELPQHFAVSWIAHEGGLKLGDELLELDAVAESLASWNNFVTPPQENDLTQNQIEHLTERLQQITAERDRLADRLTAAPVTSLLRNTANADRVSDAVFVRTVRRR